VTGRLECDGLTGGWGDVVAIRDVGLTAEAGAIHAVLGANGAGKTTLLLTLAGLLPAHSGSVAIDGVRLPLGKATAAARAGVVLVPDNRELFTRLTVEENLRVAAGRNSEVSRSMLDLFPALEPRWKLSAGALSGGEQQMLAMARALVQRPRVLLVDELSMGLAPVLVEKLFEGLRQVASERDCTVVVVEQYVELALAVADSVTVLNRGRVVLSGAADKIGADVDALERAYLGSDDDPDIVPDGRQTA
jgi:branched-chain amino acid transport system ATP-binding protein